jgi:methanogenic corrinoid protein MtbC1
MYTEEDLQTLRVVHTLLQNGRSIGEIARLGRTALLSQPASAESEVVTASPSLDPSALHPSAFFPNGPRSLAVPLHRELARCRTTIVEAAGQIDGATLDRTLDYAFSIVSPDVVIEQVIKPAACLIGEHWEAHRCSIGGEHLASSLFLYRLRKLIEMTTTTARADAPRVVCACFPGEQHELGLLVCTYHLARRGLRVAYLGPSLPFADLGHACTALAPAAVYLSVTQTSVLRTQKAGLRSLLKRHGARMPFFIGGQGVTTEDDDLKNAGVVLWRQKPRSEKTGTTSGSLGAGRPSYRSRTGSLTPKASARGAAPARIQSD